MQRPTPDDSYDVSGFHLCRFDVGDEVLVDSPKARFMETEVVERIGVDRWKDGKGTPYYRLYFKDSFFISAPEWVCQAV